MAQTRTVNLKLAAVIAECGLSHAQLARIVVAIAKENGADELVGVGRSHVSHWVSGSKPSGRAPLILCEALSRRLSRSVTLGEIGLADVRLPNQDRLGWDVDTLVALADLGRADVDVERRRLLGGAAYSVAALALPGRTWWSEMAQRGESRAGVASRAVGRGDLEAVRDMVSMFSRIDQRRGGGHGRTAAVQYLTSDVAAFLRGNYARDDVRRDMFSAASELSYLSGWMAFDNAEHAIAQHYFGVAVKLAAEADDPAMAGHVLRAMAHQAIDLGHNKQAFDIASASMEGACYRLASPRERALFGVVYARTLAGIGERNAAARALLHAERDLAAAKPGDDEPSRVFFFGEASVAHETACALRDTGDTAGAIREFRRSVKTRKATTFTRTHAITLGYLGAVQTRQGGIEEACSTWNLALEAMDGIRSGRTRDVANNIRSVLSPLRARGIRAAVDTDARAAAYLASIR